MRRPTPDGTPSGSRGPHAENTPTGATDRARLGKLRDYLHGLPGLDFTDKGRATICRRFQVSDDELTAAVAALAAPRLGAATPALLRTIARAVGHAEPDTTGGEGPW